MDKHRDMGSRNLCIYPDKIYIGWLYKRKCIKIDDETFPVIQQSTPTTKKAGGLHNRLAIIVIKDTDNKK